MDQLDLPYRVTDTNDDPVSGALVYVYRTGTTTDETVYSDSAGTTPHSQPITCDGSGVIPQIFYSGGNELRVLATTSGGSTVFDRDPIGRTSNSSSAASGISINTTTGNTETNVEDFAHETQSQVNDLASVLVVPDGGGSGALDDVAIGGTTPAAGAFTTVSGSGAATFSGGLFTLDRTGESANARLRLKADAAQVQSLQFYDFTGAEYANGIKTDGSDNLAVGGSAWQSQTLTGTWQVSGVFQTDTYDEASASGVGVLAGNTGRVGVQRESSALANANMIQTFRGTTNEFVVKGDGDVQNTNNSYGAISDARIKKNVTPAKSQWADIAALKLVNYELDRGAPQDDGATLLGFVAQDLIAAGMPGLTNHDPETDLHSVKYSVAFLKAIGALQEAMRRIEALEAAE